MTGSTDRGGHHALTSPRLVKVQSSLQTQPDLILATVGPGVMADALTCSSRPGSLSLLPPAEAQGCANLLFRIPRASGVGD